MRATTEKFSRLIAASRARVKAIFFGCAVDPEVVANCAPGWRSAHASTAARVWSS
jgi:hypothetical protein